MIDIHSVAENLQEIVEGTPSVSKVVWSVVQKNNHRFFIVTKGVIKSSSSVVNNIFQLLDRDKCDMPDDGLDAINTLKSSISNTHSVQHEVESALSQPNLFDDFNRGEVGTVYIDNTDTLVARIFLCRQVNGEPDRPETAIVSRCGTGREA